MNTIVQSNHDNLFRMTVREFAVCFSKSKFMPMTIEINVGLLLNTNILPSLYTSVPPEGSDYLTRFFIVNLQYAKDHYGST